VYKIYLEKQILNLSMATPQQRQWHRLHRAREGTCHSTFTNGWARGGHREQTNSKQKNWLYRDYTVHFFYSNCNRSPLAPIGRCTYHWICL